MFGGVVINENNDFPWVVMILGQISSSYSKMCSGSVVSPHWVLTAAHCLIHGEEEIPVNMFSVDVYYRFNQLKRYEVHSAFKHPKFSIGKQAIQDLGLLRTVNTIEGIFKGVISTSPDYPNKSCTILGYGLRAEVKNESHVPALAKLTVNLLPINMCQTFYSADNPLLCLFVVDGTGPCTGDSGSPMICENQIVGVCSRAVFGSSKTACGVYDVAVILYQRLDQRWLDSMIASDLAGDNSNVVHTQSFPQLIFPLLIILLRNL